MRRSVLDPALFCWRLLQLLELLTFGLAVSLCTIAPSTHRWSVVAGAMIGLWSARQYLVQRDDVRDSWWHCGECGFEWREPEGPEG